MYIYSGSFGGKVKSLLSLSLLFLFLAGCNIYQTPVDKQEIGLLKDDKASGDPLEDDFSDCGPIDFKAIDKKIFSPYCVDCHNEFDAAKNVRVDDYAEVIDKLDRIKHQIEIDRMPKSRVGLKLSPEEKRYLYAWIYQGAPEKTDQSAVESCNLDGTDFVPPTVVVPPVNPPVPPPVVPPTVPPTEPPPTTEPTPPPVQPPPVDPPPVVIPPVVIPPIVIPPIIDPNVPEELYDYAEIKKLVLDPVCLQCHGVRVLPALDSYADIKRNIVKIESLVRSDKMPPRRPLADPLKIALFAWIKQGAPETK